MAWTPPTTWQASQIVDENDMNTHVRDNLNETSVAKSTAAGDMTYATGPQALTRLAIGTVGQVLRVNSSTTAPEWGNYQLVSTVALSSGSVTMTGNNTWQDVTGLTATVTLEHPGTVIGVCSVRNSQTGADGPGNARVLVDGTTMQLMENITGDDRVFIGVKNACSSGARIVKVQHFGANANHAASFYQWGLLVFAFAT